MGYGFGPGDGERVRGPKTDGRDGEVDVLAWGEFPGPCEEKGYAESVAWEGFDLGGGGVAANVAVEEGGETEDALVSVSGTVRGR